MMTPLWAIRNDQNRNFPGAHTSQKNFTLGVPVNVDGPPSNPGGDGGDPLPPDPPQEFVIDVFTDGTITIDWVAPVDKGTDPGSLVYPVQYKQDNGDYSSGFTAFGDVAEPPATITGLTPNITYALRVASKTNDGQSSFTDVLIQQTLPPFPSLNQLVQLQPFNDSSLVYDTYQRVITNEGEEYVPASQDGDPVGVWNYDGGNINQPDESKRAVLRTDINNFGTTFAAVEFQGGANLLGYFIQPSDGTTGWEALIVHRRFAPQPPTDRQTTGLWSITGESPTPPATDVTDSHYPDDNGVIYERFGSDVRRSIFPIPLDVTEWHIMHIRAREGEYKIWLNEHLVIDSTDNVLANAPLTPNQVIGISRYWPDGLSNYNGYFQLAAASFSVPDEGEDDAYRDGVTAQLRAYYTKKFGILEGGAP